MEQSSIVLASHRIIVIEHNCLMHLYFENNVLDVSSCALPRVEVLLLSNNINCHFELVTWVSLVCHKFGPCFISLSHISILRRVLPILYLRRSCLKLNLLDVTSFGIRITNSCQNIESFSISIMTTPMDIVESLMLAMN